MVGVGLMLAFERGYRMRRAVWTVGGSTAPSGVDRERQPHAGGGQAVRSGVEISTVLRMGSCTGKLQ